MGQSSSTVAALEWPHPEPMREATWAEDGKPVEVEISKPFGAQKIMSESQMSDIEFCTLLDLGLTWICLQPCPVSSLLE